MLSEGCGCIEAADVGELLLAEAGAVALCHCERTLRPRGRRLLEARQVAYLATLARGLRTGVVLTGVTTRAATRLHESHEQALRALLKAYADEGDADGVQLCLGELEVLGHKPPQAGVDGCVVASVPLLGAPGELECCFAPDGPCGPKACRGWEAAGSMASLTLFTTRGVIQVSTVDAVPVVESSWRDAWVEAVLGAPELTKCSEPIAGFDLDATVHLMPTPPTAEAHPDTLRVAPAVSGDPRYRCPELADLLEQHIAAIRRGDEPPDLTDVRVTFTPLS